jgi:hypothetical protein
MKVKSSALKSVVYNQTDNVLSITFKSGRSYNYFDVSKRTYDRLIASESKGRFVNRWITPRYDYLPQ